MYTLPTHNETAASYIINTGGYKGRTACSGNGWDWFGMYDSLLVMRSATLMSNIDSSLESKYISNLFRH